MGIFAHSIEDFRTHEWGFPPIPSGISAPDGLFKTDEDMELNIDTRLIFAILNGKVSAAIRHKLSADFGANAIGLTPEQWIVLLYLSEQDGVTQQRLCDATYTGKPSMTRLVDAMEREGIVRRLPNPRDRRSNFVCLTHRGRMLKARAMKVATRTLRNALRGLGQESLVISQEVLRQIFLNTTQGG